MSGFNYVKKDTLEQMKIDLQRMKSVDRPAASRAIAEAKEKGDLKENAEYDAAKEAQGHLESKIAQMEGIIANTRVLDESSIDTSKVSILTKVTLTNLNTRKQVTYQLVSENEADLKAGKISVTSPIGKGLLGKKPGEVAEVQAPVDRNVRFGLARRIGVVRNHGRTRRKKCNGQHKRSFHRSHLFLKTGLRFSMKAAMPSFWSSSENCD